MQILTRAACDFVHLCQHNSTEKASLLLLTKIIEFAFISTEKTYLTQPVERQAHANTRLNYQNSPK